MGPYRTQALEKIITKNKNSWDALMEALDNLQETIEQAGQSFNKIADNYTAINEDLKNSK